MRLFDQGESIKTTNNKRWAGGRDQIDRIDDQIDGMGSQLLLPEDLLGFRP